MYLVRDVLDKQVVDRRQARIGKVDGIVLTMRNDGRLKIAFVEMGTSTLVRRLNRRLYRWMLALSRRGSEPAVGAPIESHGRKLPMWASTSKPISTIARRRSERHRIG